MLLFCLDRNRFDARLLNRCPDCPGIRRIILVAHDERFDELAGQQLDLMTQLDEFPRPVLSAAARFHADQAGLTVGKMLQKLLALELQIHDLSRFNIHPVQLKYPLCNVNADYGMLHDGSSGLPVKNDMFLQIWHFDAVGP